MIKSFTKVVVIAIVGVFSNDTVSTQTLPYEMYLSPDGRMLYTGGKPDTGLYDEANIRSIYLDFPQSNYWQLMINNYASKTDIPATMTVDGIVYDSVGVRFKGQTSYSQTGSSQKKSFNITLDYVDSLQEIMGYETLNLNNCFQDESFLREFFFLHQIRNHIPAAKCAFVKLYINGGNWGLYPSVQQLNKDYLKEWFLSNNGTNWRADRPPGTPGPPGGWGDGTAALNYHGPNVSSYTNYYTLKSTDKASPWQDLINTCSVLENPTLANLPNVLPDSLDVDRTLWFLASEILFSDDDSYIYKGKMDYYLYWESETGRCTPLEFDGNSVMDSSFQTWSLFYNQSNPNYPLMNRMFAVPQYRQRYLAHMRTLMSEVFDTTLTHPFINGYKALIDTIVLNDPKKLYTYTQFQNGVNEVKNFIRDRRNYLMANTELQQVGPSISNVSYYTNGLQWTAPSPSDSVNVNATVTSTNGIDHVSLYYSTELVGNFTPTLMYDDGLHNDSLASDGIFGGIIPAQAAGDWVRFYIEAVSANTAKTVKYDPPGAEHNVYIYVVTPLSSSDTSVVINEIMASNSSTASDTAGEFDDWIELYNKSNNTVDISGYFLTDNLVNLNKWEIPAGTIMQPNSYLIIWADEDSSQGAYHANFKLSASGELLYLLNPQQELVDSLFWGPQITDMGYARVPNGYGNFIIQAPTFGYNNNLVGIAESNPESIYMNVYPNPAGEFIQVDLSSTADGTFEIMNAIGENIFSSPHANSIRVNVSEWAAGIYIARFCAVTRKVVVRH